MSLQMYRAPKVCGSLFSKTVNDEYVKFGPANINNESKVWKSWLWSMLSTLAIEKVLGWCCHLNSISSTFNVMVQILPRKMEMMLMLILRLKSRETMSREIFKNVKRILRLTRILKKSLVVGVLLAPISVLTRPTPICWMIHPGGQGVGIQLTIYNHTERLCVRFVYGDVVLQIWIIFRQDKPLPLKYQYIRPCQRWWIDESFLENHVFKFKSENISPNESIQIIT